jgi:hypothetical protein
MPTVAVGTSFSVQMALLCRRPSSWPFLFGTYVDGSDKLPSAQNLAVGTLTLFHTPPLTSRRRSHRQMKHRRYNIFIDMEQKKKGGYVNSKLIY